MMEEYKVTMHNEEDTIYLAQNLESEKFPNMVICLYGDLGSGKTVFAKAFAHAMGIDGVTSSTFNIIKEYNGELPLYHMDVYRVDDNVDNLGIEEYFEKGGVSIIEWADLIKDYLPEERIDIKFKVVDENTRILHIKAYGEDYIRACEDIL
ncbi:MAG: tRNA (adenosine(37)-N6)-threonylcarbamoyltransferase complex ATPase subunit type 1 TsaE [Bacilli bacterium]|nr:tRNA (adenosine(37)-N6)-threonylcarbamoyltransferase complex ATPase subunit type 1 TsaE [Bacilli bacterium]